MVNSQRRGQNPYSTGTYLNGGLIVLSVLLVVSIVVLSSVPPVSRDALSHHLAVPKLYLKHGGMHEIPYVVFSYYPMNVDLLYLLPLYFGNDIAAKYIHFSFALLTAWLIFSYLYQRINEFYALLGALFFLSIPVIVKLSITVYVDLGLVFFSTASIIQFLKWMENRFKLKHLIFSGCWCGLALGTKYNGLVILFLLTLFVPLAYLKKNRGDAANQCKAVGFAVIFMAVALLIFSPWMMRNYLWKQNPIYPLYHSWFSRQAAPAPVTTSAEDGSYDGNTDTKVGAGAPRSKERVGLFGYRKIIYNETWWEIALVPLRIFFSGKDGDPRYFDGILTPFLFLLPFFAFVRSPDPASPFQTEKWIWLFFSLLYLLIAFFRVEMRIRYVAPIVPPLTILSMMGLHQVEVRIHNRFAGGSTGMSRMIIPAVMGIMLLINAVYITHQFKEVQPIGYLSGRVGRDAYIETYRKEYPVVQYANMNLSSNAKILGVHLGNRIYHSDRKMISDTGVLLSTFRKSDTPQKISTDLRRRGLTHMIIRMDLFNNWLGNNFDQKKKGLVQLFFDEKMRLIYYKNGYGLFEIRA